MRDKYLNAGVLTYGSSKEFEFKVAINKVTKAIQDASITGIGEVTKAVEPQSGSIDWTNIFGKLIETAPKFIPQPGQGPGGYNYQPYPIQQQPTTTGISTNTLLLFGAGGLVLYFILRKK